MGNTNVPSLVKLGNTDLPKSDPQDDLRGRWVIDCNGLEIGYVTGLLLDTQEWTVRFLQVVADGAPWLGERTVLLPAEAVLRTVGADDITVVQTTEYVASAPKYNPDLTYDQAYYEGVYTYYGYPPFWGESCAARRQGHPWCP
jgi:hypothetical protein